MNKKHILALFVGAAMTFASCEKEENPIASGATAPTTQEPNYPANHDQFNFVNTATIVDLGGLLGGLGGGASTATETKLYTATAFSSDGNGGLRDMGEVKVEGLALTKQSNNMYLYSDFTNPLTPSGYVDWTVGGKTYSNTKSIPQLRNLAKRTEFSLTSRTLDISSRNADYILVVITSGDKAVTKTFSATTTTAQFSAAEVADLKPTTSGFIQITPYNYMDTKVEGRDAILGNQSTYSFVGVTISQ